MNNGFINIHRKILDNPISKKPHWAWLWIYLLLRANWDDTSIIWNGELRKISKGSFVTGRNSLSKQTGIPASTIEDILKYLETQQQIRQEKNNKYRVITIVNWERYQKSDSKSNNKATTKQQLADTDNNINKDNKENKRAEASISYLDSIPKEEIAILIKESSATESDIIRKAGDLKDYCAAHGKKYKDYRAFLRNAVKSDFPIKSSVITRNSTTIRP